MRFLALWLRQAGPPMQPPSQAMPSMKFSFSTPLLFFSSAALHSARPLQDTAWRSKLSMPSISRMASATASARPPQRAKPRP